MLDYRPGVPAIRFMKDRDTSIERVWSAYLLRNDICTLMTSLVQGEKRNSPRLSGSSSAMHKQNILCAEISKIELFCGLEGPTLRLNIPLSQQLQRRTLEIPDYVSTYIGMIVRTKSFEDRKASCKTLHQGCTTNSVEFVGLASVQKYSHMVERPQSTRLEQLQKLYIKT